MDNARDGKLVKLLRAADTLLSMAREYDGASKAGSQPLRRRSGGGALAIVLVRVTGDTANAAGYYPGVITRKDSTTGAFADYGTVSVCSPNGTALVNGTRYQCSLTGMDGIAPAFTTMGSDGGSGGGGASNDVQVVRLTGGAAGPGGLLDARLQTWDATSGTFIDGIQVWVREING